MGNALAPGSVHEEQIRRLMQTYGTSLHRVCYAYWKDAALAEDAKQDTFVKILMAQYLRLCARSEKIPWMKSPMRMPKILRPSPPPFLLATPLVQWTANAAKGANTKILRTAGISQEMPAACCMEGRVQGGGERFSYAKRARAVCLGFSFVDRAGLAWRHVRAAVLVDH